MLLVTAFLFMLLLVFSIVVITLRPTPEQRVFAKRLAEIRVTNADGAAGAGADGLLKPATDGNFEWLEEILQRFPVTSKVQLLILQANSKTTFGTLIV